MDYRSTQRWLRNVLSRVPLSPPPVAKKRDWWDKAPVLTSIFSSVVIALVGIYVSSTFQQSQLAITKENNAAQVAITTQKNQAELRLQELRLASELLGSLLSDDPKKRRIATVMLPSALSNQEMCQQILAALADDSDSGVRVAAIDKLGDANTQQAAWLLDRVHRDTSRPADERRLARDLSTKVALNSNLPQNSAFLYASVPGGTTYESERLKGGVFTHFLTRGLVGEADSSGDAKITIGELVRFIEARVPREAMLSGYSNVLVKPSATMLARAILFEPILPPTPGARFRPFLELSGSPNLIVADPKPSSPQKRVGLVAGVTRYPSRLSSLKYTRQDAERTASALDQIGVVTTTLIDPTRSELLEGLERVLASSGEDVNFYFYFAGHGWSMSGENMLGPADLDFSGDDIIRAYSIEELKSTIRRFQPASSFVFLDVCRNEITRR